MNDNQQSFSPIDLGKIIIDGNHAMLNNGQDNGNNEAKNTLIGLLSTVSAQPTQSSPTGLPQSAIDAASKVQKDYYTHHAEDLVNNHPDGIAILNQLIDTHNSSIPNEESMPKNNAQVAQPKSQSNQLPNSANFGGILSRLTGIDLQPDVTGQRISNIQGIQKLQGQEPMQQADIQKMALETQQKIDQATMVPPTQAEKMQNSAAYAGYKTSALKDMLDNTDKAMAQQNDIMKNMQGYSSWFNKPFGAMPKEAQGAMKKLQQLQLERIAVSSKLNEHQKLLASGGSSTSPFVEGQIYTDANGNKATYKNGKFQ